MGVLPGEMDVVFKTVPRPRDPTQSPPATTAPSPKISFAIIALIAAGAYMVFGGKKN